MIFKIENFKKLTQTGSISILYKVYMEQLFYSKLKYKNKESFVSGLQNQFTRISNLQLQRSLLQQNNFIQLMLDCLHYTRQFFNELHKSQAKIELQPTLTGKLTVKILQISKNLKAKRRKVNIQK
ncbi:hypothetical protein SS50377_20655 [Spironucleus salmonicida]|uniref:Uncharacterized protein n=1 Tax=Spironucleus salmonicida TaxID=348837 RepID=A0A9P8LZ82_9EUKA|nr:hypothetical protein SS50377_20655 [Spironucleus salmonicida]